MITQAILLVLNALFDLFILAALVRFWMQALRAPVFNPLGQFTIALTDWAVKPLRRVIPGAGGYDWASLVAAYVMQVAQFLAMFAIFGSGFASITGGALLFVLASAAIALLKAVIWVLIVVVIAQALLSWVAPDGPLSGLLNAMTFPFLRPLRRVIPPIGGTLDLTPLILIVILNLILMLPVRWLEQSVSLLMR
jgi:YggT family protein